jgi:hypothetical protein
MLQKSNKSAAVVAGNTIFSCFARCALAESQQLPDNREVKAGTRGITDLMLFSPS